MMLIEAKRSPIVGGARGFGASGGQQLIGERHLRPANQHRAVKSLGSSEKAFGSSHTIVFSILAPGETGSPA
jgi:hypothetical protein